ncbi:hypothetical protein CR513_17935, partial [Mucuna pruriens]
MKALANKHKIGRELPITDWIMLNPQPYIQHSTHLRKCISHSMCHYLILVPIQTYPCNNLSKELEKNSESKDVMEEA